MKSYPYSRFFLFGKNCLSFRVVALLVLTLGYSNISYGWCIFCSEIEKAAEIIENVNSQLSSESNEWRKEWQKTRNEVPEKLRGQFDLAFQRAMSAAGESLRCNTDFIRGRLKQDLLAIINKRRTLSPVVCKLSPTDDSIRLTKSFSPKHGGTLSFVGYDLDSPDVQIMLEDKNGRITNLTNCCLNNPTHYRLTVNLSRVNFNSLSQRIIVKWSGDKKSVGIEQPKRIQRYLVDVTFNSIYIKNDSEGKCGNYKGELKLDLRVNDLKRNFPKSGTKSIRDNNNYNINEKFGLVLSENQDLSIYVNGTEIDDKKHSTFGCNTGENDALGSHSKKYNINDNWGNGIHNEWGQQPSGFYKITYTIKYNRLMN